MKAMPEPRRVVVICPYGVGNLILALPALATLRNGFPDWSIHFISTLPSTTRMLKTFPMLCDLYDSLHEVCLPRSPISLWSSLKEIFKIRKLYPQTSLVMFPSFSFHYNLLNYLVGARHRLGFRFPDDKFTNLAFLNNERIQVEVGAHDVEQNLKIIHALGTPKVEHCDLGFAQKYFLEPKDSILGIHAGCKKGYEYKQWSKERYSRTVEQLLQNGLEYRIRIFFGPDEHLLFQYFSQQSWAERVEFIHSLELDTVLKKIAECSIFLANDSGLMHLAVLTSCPHVIALIGPSDSRRTGPYDKRAKIVPSGVECKACSHNYELASRKFHCSHVIKLGCLQSISETGVVAMIKDAIYAKLQ